MDALDAMRDWLDGLAGILAPRQPRPALVPVERVPRPIQPRPRRPAGGVYRPLKG